MENRYGFHANIFFGSRETGCLIDWVRSSNFISWLLYNQYAFCVQPLVKRSIRVVKVRYLLYRLWTLHSMERRGESQRGRGLRVRYNFCRRDRESRREAARQRGADLNRKRARGKAAAGVFGLQRIYQRWNRRRDCVQRAHSPFFYFMGFHRKLRPMK